MKHLYIYYPLCDCRGLYEQDDCRLPEGMKRVGYDADSGRYLFRDKDGCLWEGQEGARFGEMIRGTHVFIPFDNFDSLDFAVEVSDARTATHNSDEDDMENGSVRAGGYVPVPGSAVGSFDTLMCMLWVADIPSRRRMVQLTHDIRLAAHIE